MNRRHWFEVMTACCGGTFWGAAGPRAARATAAADPADLTLPLIGQVCPRSAREIKSSSWSIGGETLDRDFAVYDHYKPYLGPLGAKHIRLQAGWAKCERQRGVYAWDWLDAIVDDAVAQRVQPWLQLSYGNTLYPGGGGTGLGGGVPSSPAGLAAWDAWSKALATRYRDRIHEWEIWNEPDLNRTGEAGVEAYAELYTRTAMILREVQPDGTILALGLAHDLGYAERFLAIMKERQQLDLIDAITFHTYPRNPDDTAHVDKLRAMIARTGRAIEVRQGETGAPSQLQSNYALSGFAWTPHMQAKWNLRRMLAHHAKEVPFNLFTLCDLHYRVAGGGLDMNYKGLLATNPDQTVTGPKPCYHAVQRVFTIFDDSLEVIPNYAFSTTSLRGLSVSGYVAREGKGQIAAFWFSDAPPDDTTSATAIDLTLKAGHFVEPVLVVLHTGRVHALPPESWTQEGPTVSFLGVPAYDSPVLIAEKRLIPLDVEGNTGAR